MKRILFLFTASLLLLACSNDDENLSPAEPVEYNIKTFSRNLHFENNSEIYELVRLFDESGETIRESDFYSDLTLYWDYSYNPSGKISSKDNRNGDDIQRRTDVFSYDSNDEIESIAFMDAEGGEMSVRNYTHENDKIIFHQESIYGEIYYNSEGLIIKNYGSGDTGNWTQTIEYAADNITRITTVQSDGRTEIYSFEYDDGINPLYDYVQNNYFNATIGDHRNLFSRHNYFSKNNFTRISYNSSIPDNNYIETKTTVYNEDGYPISAIIKRNEVLREELSYEYY